YCLPPQETRMQAIFKFAISTLVASATLLYGGTMHAQQKTTVVLGTATPGGGFPLYGKAFADAINETDPTLFIETKNTKGSTENIPLLEEGKLDLGLVQGEAAHGALVGS